MSKQDLVFGFLGLLAAGVGYTAWCLLVAFVERLRRRRQT